jgi:hypothetical protein
VKPSGRPPVGGEEQTDSPWSKRARRNASAAAGSGGAAVELAVAVEQRRQHGEIGEHGLANENGGHGRTEKRRSTESLRL